VLLLDEPTAALAPAEIEASSRRSCNWRQRSAILIVTHKLQEVTAYATRVTVMRHGKVVERTLIGETSIDAIARAMVGGELPAVAQRATTQMKPCLHVRDLCAGRGRDTLERFLYRRARR